MKLSEICLNIVDCPHSTAPDEGSGYALIRTPNIGKGRFNLEGVHRISEDAYKKRCARITPTVNDLILAREAPAGNVAIIKENMELLALGQRTVLIRPNPEKVYPDFLVYYLLAPQQQNELLGRATGATVAHVNIPIINNLPVTLPPLETQQKIAGILSAYDDLIENNRKQIKLLEEAAQKLYKEWFVKFNFPGHENVKNVDGVPETWKKTTIGELIEYEIGGGWGTDNKEGSSDIPSYVIRGTDIDDIKEGNFSNIPFRYQSNNTIKTRQLQTNDIIFEVSGGSKNFGVGRSLLFSDKLASRFNYSVLCASFCKLIRLKEITISNYVYDSLKYWRFTGALQPYERRSASNIVNFGWQDFLNMKEIIIPSEAILVKYLSMTETFKEKIDTCTSQIQFLQSARDKILPKLMNGDIL